MRKGIDVVICGGGRYGQERQYESDEQREADKPRILRERVSLIRHMNKFYVEHHVRTLTTDGTTGAMALAAEWAQTLAIPVIPVQSDIAKYGTGAQVHRRKSILQALLEIREQGAEVVIISFPGGDYELEVMAKARGITVENVALIDMAPLQAREVA